jgi:hypothetical protein
MEKIIKNSDEEVEEVIPKQTPIQVIQVATETQEMFNVNGELMNLNAYLCYLGNKILNIEKGVIG